MGHTKTQRGTPSLNPGLWYNWYPPIVGPRQAKKTRTAATQVSVRTDQKLTPPVLSTEVLAFRMWLNSARASFIVGGHEEKAEKGVRAGKE
jgi:hypothetical protein